MKKLAVIFTILVTQHSWFTGNADCISCNRGMEVSGVTSQYSGVVFCPTPQGESPNTQGKVLSLVDTWAGGYRSSLAAFTAPVHMLYSLLIGYMRI